MTKGRFEELMRKGGVTNQTDIDGAWAETQNDPRFYMMEKIALDILEESLVDVARRFVDAGIFT